MKDYRPGKFRDIGEILRMFAWVCIGVISWTGIAIIIVWLADNIPWLIWLVVAATGLILLAYLTATEE
jgi:hypothetical protein